MREKKVSKFPRLEAMRRQRDQRERELIEPWELKCVRAENARKDAAFRADRLERTVQKIQEALGNKVMDHIIERMSYDLASRLYQEITEAVLRVKPASGWEDVYFKLSPATMASLDPDALLAKIRDQYLSGKINPRCVFSGEIPTGTVFRIDIPSLSIQEVIWNDPE